MASSNDTNLDVMTYAYVTPQVFPSDNQIFTTSVAITNYSDAPQKNLMSEQFKKFREMLWLRRAKKELDAQDNPHVLSFFD